MEKFRHRTNICLSWPRSRIFTQSWKPLSFFIVLFSIIPFTGQSWSAPASNKNLTNSLLPLPYIQHVETEKVPVQGGTAIYKKEKAFSGYSIYTTNASPNDRVDLIDMDGTLVHRWQRNEQNKALDWQYAIPFPSGSIFLTTLSPQTDNDWELIDANSRAFAFYYMPGQDAHHGAYCLKDGSFLGIVTTAINMTFNGVTRNIYIKMDSLIHMSSKGQMLKIIPLSKLFETDPGYQASIKKTFQKHQDLPTKPTQPKPKKHIPDFFHTVHIVNLEWDIPDIAKKGDWLVTLRNQSKIIIVDPEKEKIIWQWGGKNTLQGPHDAKFLKGNRILLMDNGLQKESSRVLIVDIKSRKILWQYGQKPGQEFFTNKEGSAQELPNGNILIAESTKGRAFEVTPSGEIVWEWHTEFFSKRGNKKKRRAIYRITRIPYGFFKDVKFNYGKIGP